jgi:hypothetical protein
MSTFCSSYKVLSLLILAVWDDLTNSNIILLSASRIISFNDEVPLKKREFI